MIGRIDLEALEQYRAFLSNYSGDILGLTNSCLQKANSMKDQWNDSHVDEVINELIELKNCIDKFSGNCEQYGHILQEIIERYRLYLSGHFSG